MYSFIHSLVSVLISMFLLALPTRFRVLLTASYALVGTTPTKGLDVPALEAYYTVIQRTQGGERDPNPKWSTPPPTTDILNRDYEAAKDSQPGAVDPAAQVLLPCLMFGFMLLCGMLQKLRKRGR